MLVGGEKVQKSKLQAVHRESWAPGLGVCPFPGAMRSTEG